jgi:hypothetical protein
MWTTKWKNAGKEREKETTTWGKVENNREENVLHIGGAVMHILVHLDMHRIYQTVIRKSTAPNTTTKVRFNY